MKLALEKRIRAPAEAVWHATKTCVDLRVGGHFSSRMEANDGCKGFDVAGPCTTVRAHRRIGRPR